jgi:hypothetical protein
VFPTRTESVLFFSFTKFSYYRVFPKNIFNETILEIFENEYPIGSVKKSIRIEVAVHFPKLYIYLEDICDSLIFDIMLIFLRLLMNKIKSYLLDSFIIL